MPKGPRGEKRPTDMIGNAVHIMEIAVGGVEDAPEPADAGKNPAAAVIGRKGGKARAEATTPERRSEVTQRAPQARYGKRF